MATFSARSDDDGGKKRERNPIQHSFDILEILSGAPNPLSLAEISDHMDVHKSTVARLLTTLAQRGYVERIATTGRYELGSGLIALAGAALQRNPLAETAQPIMDEIAKQSRETITLSVWSGDHAIDIAVSPGTEQISYLPTIGMRNPAHCTATGKIFLASFSPARRDELLARPMLKYTYATIVDRERLMAELAEVKKNAVAWNIEEFTESLCALGVPVMNGKEVVAALVASIPKFRFDESKKAACLEALRRGAYAIAARR